MDTSALSDMYHFAWAVQRCREYHNSYVLLVLVLVITGKGTACIPDQHKIGTITIILLYKNKSRIN